MVRLIGLALGPSLAFIMFLLPAPDGLSAEGWRVAALLVLMAVWWCTEAIPIPATSLLPLVFLPVFGGGTASEAASGYASPIVLLLLGGFIVAMGIERWNLHTRIALNVVLAFGQRPKFLIAGFMTATALLSAWISNSATTLMMLPIAISVAATTSNEDDGFTKALLLGICYAASIGGMATPIGTPTNLIAIDWLETNTGTSIGYEQWLMFGIPAVLLMIPLALFVLTRNLRASSADDGSAARDTIREKRGELGALTTPELRVSIVFGLVALAWVLRLRVQELLGDVSGFQWINAVSDMSIAMAGAVAMFLVPAGKAQKRALLDWKEAENLPWGVLILFGGGITLGRAVSRTGLADWIGGQVSFLEAAPLFVLIIAIVAFVIFLTEITSNVATMTTLAPIIGALALGVGMAPEALIAPAAIAASCAFMLPVATAPNAIVFASGHVTVADMIRAGFLINLCGIFAIGLIGYFIAPAVF